MPKERTTEAAASPDAAEARRSRRPRRLRGRARREAGEHSALGERLIAGVPARIMRPRIIFTACLAALLGFGLLMVYSASSVEALSEYGSSTYYLERQAIFILVGTVVAFVIAQIPLKLMRSNAMWYIWMLMLLLLAAVLLFGRSVGGARRWISLPLIGQLQPSEFAKAIVIALAAKIMHEYYEVGSTTWRTFLIQLALCVALPLVLIILEPDMGTCLIIAGSIFIMCYFAGFSYKLIIGILLIGLAVAGVFIFSSSYRVARVFTASDPWADPYGDGYQATLAIMAFASGGLFGRGIGNSTMKYNYLPEAHNDYILAIIGEELGFVGVVILFAVFALFFYSGFKIARQAPTVQGRLMAYGCTVMIMIQFLVNVLGILGVTPMTGKPLPFISYGGSSMIGMMMLVGLVLRVSIESNPRTVYDARRADFRVMDAGDPETGVPATIEGSTAGMPRPRSARRHEGFSVVDGTGHVDPDAGARPVGWRRNRSGATDARSATAGRQTSVPLAGRGPSSGGRGSTQGGSAGTGSSGSGNAGRSSVHGGSYERVDLGADPADRLRSHGPQRRYDDDSQ